MFKCVQIVLAAIAAVAIFGLASFLLLDRACSTSASSGQDHEHQQVATDKSAEARIRSNDASRQQGTSQPDSVPNLLVPADMLQAIKQGDKSTAIAGEQPRDWGHSFLCDVKITDALIALFTLCLVVIGAWQGVQLKFTVDAANKEFISSHRPKIILREAIAKPDLDGQPVKVEFVLSNIGDTNARIVQSALHLEYIDEDVLVNIPDLADITNVCEMVSGESCEFEHEQVVYTWRGGTIWAHGVQIPARGGQSFRRIADSIPVIADSF